MPDHQPGEPVAGEHGKGQVPGAPPTPAITHILKPATPEQPTPTAAPPQPPAKIEGNTKSEADRIKSAERWMILLTGVIAFLTFANVGIFYLESENTGKQIDKLADKAEGIVGAMNTALSNNQEAVQKAFKANRDAVDASEKQSRKALDASIALAHDEERAWIVLRHKYDPIDFQINGPITYSIGFLNTGKTPANAVESIVRAEVLTSHSDPSLTYERGTSNVFRSGELVPNDDGPPQKLQVRDKGTPILVSPERLRRVQSGIEKVTIYGQMTYRDIAGPHWMRFCWETSNAEPLEEQEAPQKCEQYNSSGDGKAPPTVR